MYSCKSAIFPINCVKTCLFDWEKKLNIEGEYKHGLLHVGSCTLDFEICNFRVKGFPDFWVESVLSTILGFYTIENAIFSPP